MSGSQKNGGFDQSRYERLNENWVCGWAADGCPCHVGPSAKGECQAHRECVPILKDDRWMCSRPQAWGGKCQDGPLPDGSCPHEQPKCQPRRSLLHRRKSLTFSVAALALGSLALMFGSSEGTTLVSPGELAFQHSSMERRCADCHAAGGETVQDWVECVVSCERTIEDSKKCLECHNLGTDPLRPHAVGTARLSRITERLEKQKGSQDEPARFLLAKLAPQSGMNANGQLACAVCHHEHRGKEFDLKFLTDVKCQSCHVRKFHDFTNGHPEFSHFPYKRRTRVRFDHSTHYGSHFANFKRIMPQGKAPKSCQTCHYPERAGKAMLVRSFDKTCASCHSEQIEEDLFPGILFVALPAVDLETLKAPNANIGNWPVDVENAQSDLPAFMRIMLNSDEKFVAAQRKLKGVDLANLKDANDEQIQAAEEYVWAIKALLSDITKNRQEAIRQRLGSSFGDAASNPDVAALADLRSQSDFFVESLLSGLEIWLPNLSREVQDHNDGKPQATKPVTVPNLNTLFHTLDENGDGELTREELRAHGFFQLIDAFENRGTDAEQWSKLLKEEMAVKLDENGDGELTSEELRHYNLFRLYDANRTGETSLSDFYRGALFDELDADGDGHLRFSEFRDLGLSEAVRRFGAWRRDDGQPMLRYQATGHADTLLRGWLDVCSHHQETADQESQDPKVRAHQDMFRALSDPVGPGRCLKCHTADRQPNGSLRINWQGWRPIPFKKKFTHFSHKPHLTILRKADCANCHLMIESPQFVRPEFINADWTINTDSQSVETSGFDPIKHDTCAVCHNKPRAGQDCVECHNYHIGVFPPPK